MFDCWTDILFYGWFESCFAAVFRNPTSKSQPFVPQLPQGQITCTAFSLKQWLELLFPEVVVDVWLKLLYSSWIKIAIRYRNYSSRPLFQTLFLFASIQRMVHLHFSIVILINLQVWRWLCLYVAHCPPIYIVSPQGQSIILLKPVTHSSSNIVKC